MSIKRLLFTGVICSTFINLAGCTPGTSGNNYIPSNQSTTALKEFGIVSSVTSLAIGNKTKLVPNIFQADGSKIETPSPAIEWSVSDNKLATVDKDGNVTAVSDGTVVVIGKLGSKSSAVTIIITKLPEFPANTTKDSKEPTIKANPSLLAQIKYIVIKLPLDTVNLPSETNSKVDYTLDTIEAETKFVATAYNQDNKPLEGIPFTWISSDANIASVNTKGIVKANATGSTNLIVTAGDKASNILKLIIPNGKANINVSFQGD